jgi:xanthine/uracil permease
MSVYLNSVQVGSVQDVLSYLMPLVTTIVVIMIVLSLIKSLLKG